MIRKLRSLSAQCRRSGRGSIAVLLLLVPGFAAAQPVPSKIPAIRFENLFDQSDSISHQMGGVNAIIQGPLGFIWMGAENGLGRYDGRHLKLYQADPQVEGSLPASYIRDLVVDQDELLWLATEGGLARYDQSTDSFAEIRQLGDQRIDSESVSALALGADNSLYVGSARYLYVIAPERDRMHAYRPQPPIPLEPNSEQIRALAIDKLGRVWLGTAGMGVAIFDPEERSFSYLLHDPQNDNSLLNNSVNAIMHDDRGRTWLGSYGGGISLLDPATGEFRSFVQDPEDPTSLGSNVVQDITQDSEGRIWIALDQGGLALFDEQREQFHHYRHSSYDPASLVSNQLRVVFEDRNRDLWLGAFPSGVSFYNRSTRIFKHYTHNAGDPHSLSHNAILHFEQTRDGTIWIGTESGLNELDPETGRVQRYLSRPNDPQALKADAVLAIQEDIDGQLWVGTWAGGLHRLDRASGKFQRYQPDTSDPHSINSDFIWDIIKDSEDRIWLATETGGLNRYRRESDDFVSHTHDPGNEAGISGNFVSTLIEDHRGQLWLGTFTGLDTFDPETGTFKHFPYATGKPDATSSKNIRSLFEDSRGQIWAGTQHRGVNVYDRESGTFTYLDLADGLPSSTVSSIIEDDAGDIWLATTNGLARIHASDGGMSTFGREDGLVGSNFNRNASLKDDEGNLYFGSSSGVTKFHPRDLDQVSTEFPVRITAFRLFNQPVAVGGEQSPLERSIMLTEAITLEHSDAMFSFDFAALNYRQSGTMRYSYMLEGFDRAWNDIGRQASATYTNLNPGEYRFRVRASTNGQHWIEGQNLAITVLPPQWRSWWAYCLYAVLLVVVFWFTHKYINLRLRAATYKNQSITDPLTKIYNRAGIAQIAEGVFVNATTRNGMALMLLDIDHFKRVNDRRGHDAGDEILKAVTSVAQQCIRTSDHLGRWGGEEFVMLAATQNAEGARLLAEKVRSAVENHDYQQEQNPPLRVTVSIGVALVDPADTFESALKRADKALYKAKELGRNCVIMAD